MSLAAASPAHLLATFRDLAGSLSLETDQAVRLIHPSARVATLEFLRSDFYRRAEARGDMLATTIDEGDAGLRLLHPRIAVPAYPWEWTPGQWRAAAELTLSLCREALAEGWILKDASPLNILFAGGRPVLVDVVSFERRDPHSTVWLAYGQFIRTFLLPLTMYDLLAWPLAMTIFRRDGYEPAELFRFLSWRQRLGRTAFYIITLPTMLERRSASSGAAPNSLPQEPEIATAILDGRLEGLLRRTRRAGSSPRSSNWAGYADNLHHYAADAAQVKRSWVEDVLRDVAPATVLDIGANTGEFSLLAARSGAAVVALERDAAAAEQIFRHSREEGLDILTVQADLARPTPAAGWENSESTALLARLEAQSELVLMLAVIHHMLLIEQIPLDYILGLAHRLTRKHLVVEWVPPSDPMFQSLMRGRGERYGSLEEGDLLAAADGLFRVDRRQLLGNGRILFLFSKLLVRDSHGFG